MPEGRAEHESFLSVIRRVDEIIRSLEEHPDESTRERIVALLTGLDALHRTGIGRLLEGVREAGGPEVVERLEDDPVVATLLGLYGFAELDVDEDELADDPGARTGATPPPGATPAGGGGGEAVGFVPLDQVGVRRKGSDEPDPNPPGEGAAPDSGAAP